MRKTIISGAVAAYALLFSIPALAALVPAPGPGNYTFEWVGNCQDCAEANNTPTFEVRARLELKNYTLGTLFSTSNLARFDYFGSNLVAPYSVIPGVDDGSEFGGGPEAYGAIDSAAGHYEIFVRKWIRPLNTFAYRTFATDTAGGFEVSFWIEPIPEDYGTGTWSPAVSAVPEAESWAIVLMGLGALGVAMRQRKKTAAQEIR
jgi:PEP-CTERM motif